MFALMNNVINMKKVEIYCYYKIVSSVPWQKKNKNFTLG